MFISVGVPTVHVRLPLIHHPILPFIYSYLNLYILSVVLSVQWTSVSWIELISYLTQCGRWAYCYLICGICDAEWLITVFPNLRKCLRVRLSLSPYSPLWRTANRPWFCFPCRSPAWTRAWWSQTARGGPSAPAAKSQGRAPARSLSQEGEGPGRRRRPRRRRNAVPSASASPSMLTPSTSTPGLCSLSLSPWWTWSTGWRTPCEEEAAVLCEWAAIQDCI